MTLILTVANASGAYQSSDYRLTNQDTGAPDSDRAGSKQLQASFKDLDLRLAFTGIAKVGAGSACQSTVDWLSGELKVLSADSQLYEICEALKRRSASIVKPHGLRGVLELVLTVAAVGEPFRVAVISNADWSKRPPEAKPEFTLKIHSVTKPFCLISGCRDLVPPFQRRRLEALAKDASKPQQEVFKSLADINTIVAKGSRGYISEACWVTSQSIEDRLRRSASVNIGQTLGNVPYLSGDFDLSGWVKENIRAAPGKEVGIVQSATAAGYGTPLPLPTGDPRRFTLAGAAVTNSLLTPESRQGVSISISQLECALEMRLNEEVTASFAKVALASVGQIGRAFPKPMFPWPQLKPVLMIDGSSVARGWEYSVGYWVEDNTYHVVIPQSSRSVRNIAFLGPDDEIVSRLRRQP